MYRISSQISISLWIWAIWVGLAAIGCKSAGDHRRGADQAAARVIAQKQQEGLGRTEPFTIERPADTLRRRLLLDQKLPRSGPASLGTAQLKPIDHWPDDDYLDRNRDQSDNLAQGPRDAPLSLTLNESLQVAAHNSREYQARKESVFGAALDLDLERDDFRLSFAGLIDGLVSADHPTSNRTVTGLESTTTGSVVSQTQSGLTLTSSIALDLARLLSSDRSSSIGLSSDSSIEIPLLRGSGRHIVTEPLTQAERNALYAIYDFERFKRTFAVKVARDYLGVLQQLDQFQNAEQNYRSLIAARRRARRFADAGKLPEIQVDQATQDKLRARDRWISAGQRYSATLDAFKFTLGLPPDAQIDLDRQELKRLSAEVGQQLTRAAATGPPSGGPAAKPDADPGADAGVDPEARAGADAPIRLNKPSRDGAGPFELEQEEAIGLAIDHRLDLRVAEGRVYDAQRQVVVAADTLGAELTLLATASAGKRRGLRSAGEPDSTSLRFNRGRYDALLVLDVPLERTAERNQYRDSLIALERAVRQVQELEDQLKLDVREDLRNLLESREGVQIQAQAVAVAERRVASTKLFLHAGRTQIRDVLDAQEDLNTAQNALTSALVTYRMAELEVQRDMGLLEVNEEGFWREYRPQENLHHGP